MACCCDTINSYWENKHTSTQRGGKLRGQRIINSVCGSRYPFKAVIQVKFKSLLLGGVPVAKMIIICVSRFNVQTPLTNTNTHLPQAKCTMRRLMHRSSDVCSKWRNPPFRQICQLCSQQRGDEQSKQPRSLTVDLGIWSSPELQSAWRKAQKTFTTSTGIYTHLPSPFPLFLVNEHTPPSSCLKLTWQLAWCVCTRKTTPPPLVRPSRVCASVSERATERARSE